MDPRLHALPEDPNNTGSPALAGQPPAITGAGPSIPVPKTTGAGQPALSPSPSGGNANVASAPLSQNGANESQGGGGNPFGDSLVKDRGTPDEYMATLLWEQGSNAVLKTTQQSVNKVDMSTGPNAEDKEGSIEAGEQFNKAIKMSSGKSQRGARKSLENMFGDLTKKELKNEVITKGEKKEKDAQFTRFLGGMTRHEFGMFLFDWGSSMMMNADKGLAGATGMATAGAVAGHVGRGKEAAALETSTAQQQHDNQIATQEADAKTMTAEARRKTSEAAETRAALAGQGYSGEKVWLDDFLTKAGWSKTQIADFFGKAKGDQARRQDLTDALMKRISDAGILDVDPITGKKMRDFEKGDIKKWVDTMLEIESPASGPPEDETAAALAKYGTTT